MKGWRTTSMVGLAALCFGTQAAPLSQSWREPVTGMDFVFVPQGCYQMGNPEALEVDRSDFQLIALGYQGPRYADEAPVHEVCVDAFWIGRSEVTAAQWQQVMGDWPSAGRDSQPAAGVSWHQAQGFADTLGLQSSGGERFRLPTEAEWEHVCRLAIGPEQKSIDRYDYIDLAWYSVRLRRILEPSEVGQLEADRLGLVDLLGNVWEWTQDNYSPEAYLDHAHSNPRIENSSEDRVIRGGSFRSNRDDVRCSSRGSYPADGGLPHIGLRLVRSAHP